MMAARRAPMKARRAMSTPVDSWTAARTTGVRVQDLRDEPTTLTTWQLPIAGFSGASLAHATNSCIDILLRPPEGAARWRRGGDSNPRLGYPSNALAAVSYTHLTLPTSDLV